jgi:hypothetical protein
MAEVPSPLQMRHSAEYDRLSADVNGASLHQVLNALSREAGVEVSIKDNADNTEIWAAFQDLPFDEGVRRLLKGQSYVLFEAPRVLGYQHSFTQWDRSIRIFGRAGNMAGDRRLSSLPAEIAPQTEATYLNEENSIEALLQDAYDLADPENRANALHDLTHHDPEQGLAAAVATLQDEDIQIRDIALEFLAEQDLSASEQGAVALQLMAEIALTDVSRELRMAALDALAVSDEAYVIDSIGQAIYDPDPEVSELAQRLYEGITEQQTKGRKATE